VTNTITGNQSVIPGGLNNTITGDNSFASGTNSQALNNNTFVWGASGPTTTNLNNQVIFNVAGGNYVPGNLPAIPAIPAATFFINGNLAVTGAFTATSKAFTIKHPILENKLLSHICTEAPRADLVYRGNVKLNNGISKVDIDMSSNMTSGTFAALSKNPQIWLSNRTNWDLVKIENFETLSTGIFTIISNDDKSDSVIDWLVISERKNVDMDIEYDDIL